MGALGRQAICFLNVLSLEKTLFSQNKTRENPRAMKSCHGPGELTKILSPAISIFKNRSPDIENIYSGNRDRNIGT